MNSNAIADIAANIRLMEKLKSKMLSNLAGVFDGMAGASHDAAIDDKLAEIIIGAYLLGEKLGFDYDTINEIMMNKIKILILSGDAPHKEYNELSSWLKGKAESADKS